MPKKPISREELEFNLASLYQDLQVIAAGGVLTNSEAWNHGVLPVMTHSYLLCKILSDRFSGEREQAFETLGAAIVKLKAAENGSPDDDGFQMIHDAWEQLKATFSRDEVGPWVFGLIE
jgi:hypothetical protein